MKTEQKYISGSKAFLITMNAAFGAFFFGYCISVFSLASKTIYSVFDVEKD